MKSTKKFLAISAWLVAIVLLALLATIAVSCVIMMVLSLVWGMWKDALVAVALGYVAALGAFSFLDTSDWLLDLYRRLKNG